MPRQAKTGLQGFTLIEVMISLTVGIIVLSGALSFAVGLWRNLEGNEIREDVYRDARYVEMSLERDFQGTGVSLVSTVSFGSLAVWGDTIVILRIPFMPTESPPYDLDPPAGTNNPLDPGGTCGARCLDLEKAADGTFELEVADIARLQVNDERRLIQVQSMVDNGATVAIGFTDKTELLHYAAGFSGGLLLDRYSSFVQKVAPVIYYLDGTELKRAETLNLDGTPAGETIAYGVQSFEASLVFLDGDEADAANPADSDPSNDFDDITGVRITAVMGADRVHRTVNQGNLFTRTYEWLFSPRNLLYERNRI
ncbi:MAG: prepilin-type N-terminal cleavage/methylation domain-containing protein [Gemmatimonadota bacterium]|nr:MAG: prepilin-type N-terminal cleavage/methylation domain-containing protein [Gemmatimonadota bacterium]